MISAFKLSTSFSTELFSLQYRMKFACCNILEFLVCAFYAQKKPQTTLHSFYAFRHELVDQLDIFVSKLTSNMLLQLYVDATTVV